MIQIHHRPYTENLEENKVFMSQREICQPLVCGGVVSQTSPSVSRSSMTVISSPIFFLKYLLGEALWSPNGGCNLKLHITAPLTVSAADQRSVNLLPNLDI